MGKGRVLFIFALCRWQLNPEESLGGREELRNSINREPIYEWEGSQRDSLGAIVHVTKVCLQHLPCQVTREACESPLRRFPFTET